jgi:hypothetical protein
MLENAWVDLRLHKKGSVHVIVSEWVSRGIEAENVRGKGSVDFVGFWVRTT